MPDPKRLLLVTSETYPPPYRSLREIYGRLLPAMGYQVGFVFTDGGTPGQRDWNPPGRVTRISSTRGLLGGGLAAGQLRRWQQTGALRSEVELGLWDVVQVRDDPWLGLLFARACRRSRTPFVFQLSHLKEEELLLQAQRGLYGNPALNRLKASVALSMRSRVLNMADMVLAISDEMVLFLKSKGVRSHILALPEGAPSSLLRARPDVRDAHRRLDLGASPVLIYAGTLSRIRELDFLFPVLRSVHVRHPHTKLVFVGAGVTPRDRVFLEDRACLENIADSIRFTGTVDLDEVPTYIALAQVGLSPMPPGLVLRMNSPIKLFEYLAMGIPVVASDTPEQSAVLAKSGAGFAVRHSVAAFSEAVSRLLDDPKDAARLGQAGKEFVRQERTFEVLTERLAGYYDSLSPLLVRR